MQRNFSPNWQFVQGPRQSLPIILVVPRKILNNTIGPWEDYLLFPFGLMPEVVGQLPVTLTWATSELQRRESRMKCDLYVPVKPGLCREHCF
jgi:hypothetical protein